MTAENDVLHRFLLERAGVRGVLVRLGPSWREVASRADYPASVKRVLGHSLAASALLTGNIKFEGRLTLELKSEGPLRLLFTECTDAGRLRGLARWNDEPDMAGLDLSALSQAVLAITIGSAERGRQYQGLVELAAPSLADSLQNYFQRSEQLPARLLLACDEEQAVGLMLQKLPEEGGHDAVDDEDAWNRVSQLTATLGEEEMLALPVEELLYRLYHEESVRLFDAQSLAFGCSCSQARVETMLQSLGRQEVEAALEANDGRVEVDCEFCAAHYVFDRVDAERLLREDQSAPGTASTH